jgi:hypothetical protein
MYEVDVIRGLKKLLTREVIKLTDSGSTPKEPAEPQVDAQAVRQIDDVLDHLTDEDQALTNTDRQG